MDLKLKGKSVLITGATRGIGLACAIGFLREGASVTIIGSTLRSTEEAAATLRHSEGVEVPAIVADLSTQQGRLSLVNVAAAADILVNNAGAIPGGGLNNLSDSAWRRAWDLKVYGYIDTARMVLPGMMARGHGVIVNVIGIAGSAPRFDYLCGSVGNAALAAFTKAVGGQAAKEGVRVVGVNPGPTHTARLEKLYRQRAQQKFGEESRWQDMLASLPFGRLARPDEIADLVVYLASDRASYLSGLVVDADGGAQFTDTTT